VPALVAEESKLRPSRSPGPVTAATKASLFSLAHRIQALDDELAELEVRIEALLVATVPDLLNVFGVGPDTAAALVMAAGDNPERLHSEAAWAHLCGVAPVSADRARPTARSRPTTVVIAKQTAPCGASLWFASRTIPTPSSTRAPVKEGKTKAEVIRILKRYVAREVYRYLPRG
jgi:transposase